MIGDPTGRSKTRPPLTTAEIERNAETYKTQVFKLLDPQKTVVEFNSRWLIPLGSDGLIKLAANYNVAQMLERRDFKQRYEAGQPIAIHEFLYSLVQAFDSVALRADVELGGTDQLFNLNVGRDIMPAFDLPPQIVMTTPLLEGLDGVEKMSKSLGNYVGVTDAPGEMFGKLMSISDTLMWRYYLLLTDLTAAEIDAHEGAGRRRRASSEAGQGRPGHAHRRRSSTAPRRPRRPRASSTACTRRASCRPTCARCAVDFGGEPSRALTRVLVDAGLAASTSDAGRRIQQGGVKLDGQRVDDVKYRRGAAAPARRAADRPARGAAGRMTPCGMRGCLRSGVAAAAGSISRPGPARIAVERSARSGDHAARLLGRLRHLGRHRRTTADGPHLAWRHQQRRGQRVGASVPVRPGNRAGRRYAATSSPRSNALRSAGARARSR